MHTNQTVEFVREKVRKVRVIFPSKKKIPGEKNLHAKN